MMDYLNAFVMGGIICVIAQIIIDKTALTPARVVVLFVTLGVVLTAFGWYDKLIEIGGAGATVPITGFGYSLAKGVQSAVAEKGLLGAFIGGLSATAGGIAGAVTLGFVAALFCNPKSK